MICMLPACCRVQEMDVHKLALLLHNKQADITKQEVYVNDGSDPDRHIKVLACLSQNLE